MSDLSAVSATATDPAALMDSAAQSSMLSLRMKMAKDPARIDKTAQDFEAMFATQMLQPMFEGLHVDENFGGGHGEEVMRSFMLQEYGKIIAKTDRLGIAAQVKAEMLRAQERGEGGQAGAGDASDAYNAAALSQGGKANVSVQ